MNNNITVAEATEKKEQLAKEINKLLHAFVDDTGLIPVAEITAKDTRDALGELKTFSFNINLKIWI